MKQLKNGYYEFDQEILDGWIAKGIGYVLMHNLDAEMYEYGAESAFELTPHEHYPFVEKEVFDIDSEYIRGIANEEVPMIAFIVHEKNL